MFQPSIIIASAARNLVAESGGAQADDLMLVRAGYSLNAVAQRWNRLKWKFLQGTQYIPLTGPFDVTGCTTTLGSTLITTTVASGFTSVSADDLIVGGGLRGETYASALATSLTAITANVPASATVSGATLNFRRPIYSLATDFKAVYDIRLTSNARPLFYIQRRVFDRAVYDQLSAGAVAAYDLFMVGASGKIKFIRPPANADTALLSYHRRITMPMSASASALDIPQDFEDVFLAGAKAHFLADKGGDFARQKYWNDYYLDGIKQMRSDEFFLPDEMLSFEPPLAAAYYPSMYNDSLIDSWYPY